MPVPRSSNWATSPPVFLKKIIVLTLISLIMCVCFGVGQYKKSKRSDDSHSSAKPAETSYIVMSPKYKPVTESILYLIFFMYVAITHCSIYSGEEKNVQFMILTHLRPWNKVKVIKPGMNWQIKQSYNLANLKDLPQTVSTKKPISSVCVCV